MIICNLVLVSLFEGVGSLFYFGFSPCERLLCSIMGDGVLLNTLIFQVMQVELASAVSKNSI